MPSFLSGSVLVLLTAALGETSPLVGRQGNCPVDDVGYNIEAVIGQAKAKASHSWEYGTTAETLLELYNPELSVFSKNPFPDGKIPSPDADSIQALSYAKQFIRTDGDDLIGGDGAIGDPASLGVSALLLGQDYFPATDRQTQTVLNAPKYSNGAISHRASVAELWADFVYMAPPYLAYYAVHKNDTDLLKETVRQCGLYREILGGDGAWRHIKGPDNEDDGKWSTGNGWAAMGMARVLATVKGWVVSKGWKEEIGQLESLIKEILDGAKSDTLDNSLLRSYLDDDSWFGEISGTSLFTATVYRMAVLSPDMLGSEYIDWAEANRKALAGHVGDDGIMTPAANPLSWADKNPFLDGSPEGQAFGTMVGAAWRDWKCQ